MVKKWLGADFSALYTFCPYYGMGHYSIQNNANHISKDPEKMNLHNTNRLQNVFTQYAIFAVLEYHLLR